MERQPTLELVVDFQANNLPIGMSPFMLDSKLYMTGGIIVSKEEEIKKCSMRKEDLNNTIYVFDPSDPKPTFSSNPPNVPPMKSLQPRPIVVTVKGKIYFIGYKCPYVGGPSIGCGFVVFDPTTERWEMLPKPPFHGLSQHWSCKIITCIFVLDHKKYVQTRDEDHCFNVHSKSWEDATEFFESSFVKKIFPFPLVRGVVLYLSSYKVLEELHFLLDPEVAYEYLVDIGDEKICYVSSRYRYTC
ncbi:hypothetical protein L1049_023491 [Liquidambar formosana]|uniref:Uncharacterized protein n=1 Tax=Liquidambar formosana TaxID=63359 RepID=A0AAP0X440_LIQFO